MITKNCKICGKEFKCNEARSLTAQFCSREHRYEWQRLHGQRKLTEEESKKLYPYKYNNPIIFTCKGCNKEITATTTRNNRQYCSRECAGHYIGKLPTNAWNKGLDITDPRVMAKSRKSSETLKKRYAAGEIKIWSKGLTKETSDSLKEAAKNQSITRSQQGEWKENWRKSLRTSHVKAHAEGKYCNTFTKPEKAVWDFLVSRNFTVKAYSDKLETDDPNTTWYHQFPFLDTFVPDYVCPGLKRIIEVNGCYIHGHKSGKCTIFKEASEFSERNQKRDRKKISFYKRNGWKWVVLWECEVLNDNFKRFDKHFSS